MFAQTQFVGGGFFSIAMIYWIAILVVDCFFAAAVFRDAKAVERSGSTNLVLVGPVVWTIATFLTGVVGASAYWVLHHLVPEVVLRKDGSPPGVS